MPQEPAYAAERSQDGGAKAAYERAKNRMFVASVRRRGVGSPELPPQKVAPRRNRRTCGVHTGGHMRSMWTTARSVLGLCGYRSPEGDGVRPGAEGFHVDLGTALRTHVCDSGGE
ncbi:MAG: hypothetical protein RLZZ21_2486 [Planctomycetota bacterium]